jgi:sugar (pentulose or hexulose) kinase
MVHHESNSTNVSDNNVAAMSSSNGLVSLASRAKEGSGMSPVQGTIIGGDARFETYRQEITSGESIVGLELGSTRIKACLISADGTSLAAGEHTWENQWVDGHWTYSLDDIWSGLATSYADLVKNTERKFGTRPTSFKAMGISAMMHGYMAFDDSDNLLSPFRTWRDTSTGKAAMELTELLQVNIPLRWSVAHFYQAILSAEPHVPSIASLTTLAGYVHYKLTDRKVLGVGDASGMFPIDSSTSDYDQSLLDKFNSHTKPYLPGSDLRELLPEVLVAGTRAGNLTEEGAKLLDPSGELNAGPVFCPPEGDAGTGMTATNSIRPRTGNISVGTSIFAMVVLEQPLRNLHREIDMVTTPSGDAVAMVHCNNGADELSRWIKLFGEVALALGTRKKIDVDESYSALLNEALSGDASAGGILAYNNISGEPIMDLADGRPMVVRTPGSDLTLANFMRAQIYSVFAPLTIGLEVLKDEDVSLDFLNAHGGLFKTASVAQRFLAGATGTPIVVSDSASEGGAWGIALLAAYLDHSDQPLNEFLDKRIFSDTTTHLQAPKTKDAEGFKRYLLTYRRGLELQRIAAASFNDA